MKLHFPFWKAWEWVFFILKCFKVCFKMNSNPFEIKEYMKSVYNIIIYVLKYTWLYTYCIYYIYLQYRECSHLDWSNFSKARQKPKYSPHKSLTAYWNVESVKNRYSDDKMLNRCTLYMNWQYISLELCNKQGAYFTCIIKISNIVFNVKKYLVNVWYHYATL